MPLTASFPSSGHHSMGEIRPSSRPATISSSVDTPISRIARWPFSTSARRRGRVAREQHPRGDEERRPARHADGEQLEYAVRRDEREQQVPDPLAHVQADDAADGDAVHHERAPSSAVRP